MTTMATWANSDARAASRFVPNLGHWNLVVDDGWGEALDKLGRWAADPSSLADDDVEEPAAATVRLALVLARQFRQRGMSPPTRVMPNGEAGILLEWVRGNSRTLWEVDDRHRWERSVFEGGRCTHRLLIDLGGLAL